MDNLNTLVLTQYREGDKYNDFIGKFYHFPTNQKKSYLSMFENLPVEFLYYEPIKQGKGEFYGYGRIVKEPFKDKNNDEFCFVEIEEYKPFKRPVSYKNQYGEVIEFKYNPSTYNSNNAVRRVSKSFLDDVCLDGHILLNFESDAHLVNILGEQLIGSEKVGILELVKNSIDASASYCKVRFEKIPQLPSIDSKLYQFGELTGPIIVIEDDGVGMNREIIENGWLRPASTLKTDIKNRLREERENAEISGNIGAYLSIVDQLKKEHGGRIPLGEKGVGRFATNRLGTHLIIRTKTVDSPEELVLRINWNDFEFNDGTNKNLNSIGIELTKEPLSRDYGKKNSGTQIIIYGGRKDFGFDEEKIKDINKSIMRLNSPNPRPNMSSPSFHAFIECPQLTNLETKEIYTDFVPNFSLEALIDGNGIVSDYSLKFISPVSVPLPDEEWTDTDYDLRTADYSYWKNEHDGLLRKPSCGSFYIHLDAWYRAKPWIDGPDQKDMLEYLSDYGGISIYRDNVIIFPAESGTKNDWLGLSQRNIKQGYRISYYNMIGNIELDQSENIDLIDKTNREGLIENQAYKDLAKLVETVIQNILEVKYISKRDEYTNLTKGITRDPKKLGEATKASSDIIEGIYNHYSIEEDPWKILDKLGKSAEERRAGLVNLSESIKNLKKSITIIEGVQDKLTEQAGFGLAAAVSIHELNKIATNFYMGISELIDSGANIQEFQLEDLRSTSESLRSELKRLGPLRTIRNERPREFKLSQAINYAVETFKSKRLKNNIDLDVAMDKDITVYARYSTLCQILVNLFDNSVYWLSFVPEDKRKIYIKVFSDQRIVIFGDSGKGIDAAIRPYLFEAGYSMKIPPSGLGLYICKSYMYAMKGSIYETPSTNRLPNMEGAQFTIDFNHVPSRKEDNK